MNKWIQVLLIGFFLLGVMTVHAEESKWVKVSCENTTPPYQIVLKSCMQRFCIYDMKCTWVEKAYVRKIGGIDKLPATPPPEHSKVTTNDQTFCGDVNGKCPYLSACIEDESSLSIKGESAWPVEQWKASPGKATP